MFSKKSFAFCFISKRRNALSFSERIAHTKFRKNELEIQMISESLRDFIFGKRTTNESAVDIETIKEHLRKHGLWRRKESAVRFHKAKRSCESVEDKPLFQTSVTEPIEIEIPPIDGENVDQHFTAIGERYSKQYRNLVENLISEQIPAMPRKWDFIGGWTRYKTKPNGEIIEKHRVPFPGEEAMVFDVEVCMNDGSGDRPTIATAVSSKYWYSWCSHRLINCDNIHDLSFVTDESSAKLHDLIPVGRNCEKERLFIGHNVGFDRSFVKEQYDLKIDKTRFLDTMSLHIAISGLTGYQRALSFSYNTARKNGTKDYEVSQRLELSGHPNPKNWEKSGSLNSLIDVYKFYCNKELSKEPRDLFVKGSLGEIKSNFQELMSYCANDVFATFEIFCQQWKQYEKRFPHPVTLAGMLEMSVMYLPVNMSNWNRYLEEAQATYDDMGRELNLSLQHLANEACRLLKNEEYRKDVWLWDLDWSTQELRFRKNIKEVEEVTSKPKKFSRKIKNSDKDDEEECPSKFLTDLLNTKNSMNKVQPLLPGYPKWYREFCDHPFGASKRRSEDDMQEWEPGPFLISTQMRSVPKLLKLMWKGYALHYDEKEGWGFLVPSDSPVFNSEAFPYEQYLRLLNLYENRANYTKSDVHYFEPQDASIHLYESKKHQLFKSNGVDMFGCKFYRLPHKDGPDFRVGNPLGKEFLRYLDDGNLTTHSGSTANRVLKLSKALSYWKMNHKRIRAQMVIANESEKDFGALLPRVVVAGTVTRRAVEPTWLTASNAYEDRVGSELKAMIQSPKGYNFVGADVDAQEIWIASLLGDSQFGRMHGCTAIGWMTLQGNKADGTDIHSKIANLVGISRNQAKILNYGRIYGAGKSFAARFLQLSNPQMSEKEAKNKADKIYRQTKGNRKAMKLQEGDKVHRVWEGGSESNLFNKLEEIAMSEQPRTPVLGCQISTALVSAEVRKDFITSIINWVVQSSAVDYLHLMLVSMKWLMEYYNINGRFAISIHDEVRYLIAEEDRYKAALALQITNLLTRCMFAYKLEIMDLPQSIAFFNRVDIDTVLRKEVDMNCKTPSNPHGLDKGYNIKFGQSLSIENLLEIDEIKQWQEHLQNERKNEMLQ
ncbi:DNA polymerase subunit gamma-1-like protein [Dinothrombium tinctorium]|uniref:DNA-directed DNA polymerase n=1 Tax=Dinothrombium tinctorium TaxID=1965070 RepID=A0A3S3NXD5_9ACAR|nr:DNA polymerase subunit gamma-1-like protein [Dinothrombium tinctorium]